MSTVPPSPPTSPYEGRKITTVEHLLLAAYWFGNNFLWGAFLGPVLSSHATVLAPLHGAQVLGLLYTIGALPALVVPLIAGPLSDRCRHPLGRRRPFVLGGGAIAVLGLVCMLIAYSAVSLPLYFAAYLVLQIGSNIALAAYSGVIPDLVPVGQRGIASGFMAVMSQLSTLIGALFSGFLVQQKLDSAMFAILIGVYILFLVITYFGVKEAPLTSDPGKLDWGKIHHDLFSPLRDHDFRWVWITRALMMFGFYAIQPFILYYLRDVIRVPHAADEAGIVFGIILLAATVSGFLGGKISDRTGRKPVVIWSSILIGAMCLLFIGLTTLQHVLIVGTMFGIGYGAYVSVDWALGADVLPSEHDAGKDMAVWHVSMTLPQQLSPLLAAQALALFPGPLLNIDGKQVQSYALPGYTIVFVAASICFVLGGIFVKKVVGAR